MNCGVASSGSPTQKGSTSGLPMPSLYSSRIFEAASARTAGRADSGYSDLMLRAGAEAAAEKLRRGPDAQPLHDARAVEFHGLHADVELAGDLPAGLAVEHALQHLALPLAQLRNGDRPHFRLLLLQRFEHLREQLLVVEGLLDEVE